VTKIIGANLALMFLIISHFSAQIFSVRSH